MKALVAVVFLLSSCTCIVDPDPNSLRHREDVAEDLAVEDLDHVEGLAEFHGDDTGFLVDVSDQLAIEDLVAEDLVAEDLAAEDLAAEDLAAEDLAAEDLAAEDLAIEDLAIEDLAEDEPFCYCADVPCEYCQGDPVPCEDIEEGRCERHLYCSWKDGRCEGGRAPCEMSAVSEYTCTWRGDGCSWVCGSE